MEASAQAGVMIWILKSIIIKISHYTYWSSRNAKVRLKIYRKHTTVLCVYGPEEGREDANDEFYRNVRLILD
jgi:hypothetical protein